MHDDESLKDFNFYQICSLTVAPSIVRVLMLKSTPIVVKVSQWKMSSTNLFIREVFPQPCTKAKLIHQIIEHLSQQ